MANEEKMNIDIKNQENFKKKKNITIICLSAALVFITLIAGLFLMKKNKESRENNDIEKAVNENTKNTENDNENKKKEDKGKPEGIKNDGEKKPEEENNADQKNGNEDDQKKIDDLPWQFTWKGALPTSIISAIISWIIINKIISPRLQNMRTVSNDCAKFLLSFLSIFFYAFFCLIVFPAIFAIKKYKNRNYWERFKLFEKNFFSMIFEFLKFNIIIAMGIIIIAIIIIIIFYSGCLFNC